MTQNTTTTNGKARETTPPDFIAYAVSERGRGRKFWHRLGVVRKHKKGEGYNVYMDILPVDFDGRIVLMTPKADEDEGDDGRDAAAQAAGNDEIPF